MALPTISNNTPAAGSITWTEFNIAFAGQTFVIPAGNTASKFVWWLYGGGTAPSLQAGNVLPPLGAEDIILFLNKGGIGALVPTADLLDGSLIVGGSVIAQAIAANAIQTEHINANAVTADLIAANAISTKHLSAGTITADKLSVGTVSDNMVVNGSFEDALSGTLVGWEINAQTNGTIQPVTGQASSGAVSMQMAVTATTGNLRFRQTPGQYIPVSSASGRKYYVAMRAGASVATTSGIYLRCNWYDGNKALISSSDVRSNGALTTTFTIYDGQATPPATARYMGMEILFVNMNVVSTAYIDEIVAHEVTMSAQIGDGQITAVKVLANSITADRIQASTITADKLLVSDRTNYWENPDFEVDAANGIPKGTTNTNTTNSRVIATAGARGSAKCLELNALNGSNNDVYSTNIFPVVPGDEFYIQYDYKFLNTAGTTGVGAVGFRSYGANKVALSVWGSVQTGPTKLTTWQEGVTAIAGIYTVPAGTYFLQPYVSFTNNGETTNRLHIDNVTIRRMSGGELIVDGAIYADKIAANAVIAEKIMANAITADKINSNAITSRTIMANAIGAEHILADAIMARHILVNQIGAGHIASYAITSGKIAANAVTANTIAANAVTADKLDANVITAQKLYVQSRGMDLVTNGNGQLGDNTNFSALTYSKTDAPTGAVGSFDYPLGASVLISDELMRVDPAKSYRFRCSIRQKAAGVITNAYTGLAPHDSLGNTILPSHYMEQTNTRTTLAVALNPGDTTITLTSAANWTVDGGASNTHLRSMIVWNYVDAAGRVWAPGTYSRNYYGNLYDVGGLNATTGVITLKTPWAGPAMASGTVVGNGSSGGNYMYVGAANSTIPQAWTEYSGTVGGIHAGGNTAAVLSFPIATASVKIVLLGNRVSGLNPTTGSLHSFANFSLSEVAAENLAPGSVTGTLIAGNTITTGHLSANAITADKLDANAINGKTITGATVQTAATGARVVMDANGLRGYDSTGAQYLTGDANGLSIDGTITKTGGTNWIGEEVVVKISDEASTNGTRKIGGVSFEKAGAAYSQFPAAYSDSGLDLVLTAANHSSFLSLSNENANGTAELQGGQGINLFSNNGDVKIGKTYNTDGNLIVAKINGKSMVDTGWQTPSLLSNFTHRTSFGWPGVQWRVYNGFFIMQGSASNTNNWGVGATIATIPAGYNPGYRVMGSNAYLDSGNNAVSVEAGGSAGGSVNFYVTWPIP